MRAKDHLHGLLTGMRAELLRLRRVVRAAERIAKQIDERMPVYSSDLCGLYSAVAAYRKGKAKRS